MYEPSRETLRRERFTLVSRSIALTLSRLYRLCASGNPQCILLVVSYRDQSKLELSQQHLDYNKEKGTAGSSKLSTASQCTF